MSKEPASPEPGKTVPPYIAFSTLKTLASNLKAHGVPPRIDKSIMSNFSGAVAGQLMTALRFLGLINSDETPTPLLKSLVAAFGTPQWPSQLQTVLKQSYPEIFKIDLATASPNFLYETFESAYAGGGETVRKTVTFFLNAAADAEIPISTYIMKSKKPRSGAPKKRAQRQNGSPQRTDIQNERPDYTPPVERKLSEQVLAVLDADSLEKDVEQAVYVLLKYLRREGK